MMTRQPDILASVYFYPSEKGGLSILPDQPILRCPLEFAGEKFDCGIHIQESRNIAPGMTVTVPITILKSKLIFPRLNIGSRFTLWNMRTFADGIVISIQIS